MQYPSFMRPPLETDIATLWTDGPCRCVLSWVGYRYRVRLMRGPVLLREEVDLDEHVVLDISRRWRAQQVVRLTSA